MEESLAVFRDEAKENRQPEAQEERRFNSGGLDAKIKILPAPGQRRGISLDIPFYRPWRQGRSYFLEPRLNEAASAADASRDNIWQGNCDVADLQLRSNIAPIRNTIPIQYPISNCPAKKRLPSNGFIESAQDHRVQVRFLRGCALPIKH